MGLRVHQSQSFAASDTWTVAVEAPTGRLNLFVTGASANVPVALAVRQGDATDSPWRIVPDRVNGHTSSGLYTSNVGVVGVPVIPGLAYRLGVASYTSGTATGAIFG